ncbi:BRISC and BRCA1-A complex member 2-like [Pectinophora gossypiella]|uniref:BRISC and BRCA1-A complex member 2 n=1 Tax=Pectinophora gossypiella TaxID=13191 RepID=A0A1E1WPJ3_PECGO|nr:BRISC and BRCA1-A complex member 2-like [Pectinophora gossypiella]
MALDTFGIIKDISPVFRPYVQNVYQDLKLGLCKNKVDIERVSGSSDAAESQFRLVLPYCSKKLKWEVIFDASTPWFAPDFRFDDDSFLNNIDEEFLEQKLPSLSKWNENDPKALSDVISELISLYKIHQIKKLNEDDSSRASFEYSALLGDALSSEDIEVWVGGHVVEFLIKLDVDVSRLPEVYSDGTEQNPGIDSALLLVRYPNSTNAELILSPVLTKSLGNITLPLMHQSAVLMDYVPMVTELLNNKIKDLLDNEKLKRELLAQLIVKYEGAILEHDTNNAAFLFQMNDFHWILQIDIGLRFPEKPPVLTLRSVYHCIKGKPRIKVLPSCPYHNFEGYIEQQVEIFKNECRGAAPSNQITNVEN